MNNQMPNDVLENTHLKQLLVNLSDDVEENMIEDLLVLGDRPEVLSLLVYKLAKEREKTNQILHEVNAKYNKILDLLNSNAMHLQNATNDVVKYNIELSEQEEQIISYIRKHQRITAKELKEIFNYKGLNAASQRLNKLLQKGLLQKKRSGQKVYFYLI